MSNLTSSESSVAAVRRTIQEVYGDASQTVLDDRAARAIISTLREMGWASLDEVAVLIEAAGGEITVPDRLMGDGRERRVTKQPDWAAGGHKFRVSVA